MDNQYDVIIIGAGPSGASCAYNVLAQNPAASVLIVDKASFPRYKPCGGGISPEVTKYLSFDLTPAIDYVCNDVVMVANGKQLESNQYPLWLVRREIFDDYLLKKAIERGAQFIGDIEIDTIVASENKIISKDQRSFFGKVIVIAEGSRGQLAKKLRLVREKTVIAAMEYEHYTRDLNGKLYIDFDYNENGYAWNFPKSDGLSLGIGGCVKGKLKGGAQLPKKLDNYVKQFNVDVFDKTHLHGHPIMIYTGKRKLVHDNIVLIGEIAGCVDPLTAEGIRPAIKSGYLAANAIVKSLSSGKKYLKLYDKQFHRHIGKDLGYAKTMSYFLNNHLSKIVPFIATQNAVNGFMSVFSGTSTYQEKITLRRVAKMVFLIAQKKIGFRAIQ